ncbi:hypothetical protein [Streptomyces sp. NPDC056255]|uniref:hypothetical protein n=1 Tax=Streptomyces sp. NPDC056255 TaxID=3345764 RepID=UPI0035DDD7CC
MADTTRITVTLPTEQVAELRKLTDNVSGYVAEAVARQLRHQLLGADLSRHQEEHGALTEEELTKARPSIPGRRTPTGRRARRERSRRDRVTRLCGGRVRLIGI